MEPVFVFIPGEAVGKGRPRVAVRGRHATMYTPEKTVAYELAVKVEAARSMRGRALLDCPVELVLEIVTAVPASYSKARRAACLAGAERPTKKPDVDNVVKAICDAFNGCVWVDDVQVVELRVSKRYGKEAYVAASVTDIQLQPEQLQTELAGLYSPA
jgi:Holliday junction resolvase RusA-like endonuclease